MKDAEGYDLTSAERSSEDDSGGSDSEGDEVLPTAEEVEARERRRNEARRARVARVKEGVVGLWAGHAKAGV